MDPNIIDVHIHIGIPGDPESGCYWSDKFTDSLAFLAMRVITGSLFKKVTRELVEEQMLGVINGAQIVGRGVLLALDEVYDEAGGRRADITNLYVSNKYVAGLAEKNPRVLFGASVHPFRPRWQDELEFCLEHGAVLCKWLPSAQGIDPRNSKCAGFYKALSEAKLPLLCHVGPEASIPAADVAFKVYNQPARLKPALDAGVRVIFAHCATPLLDPDDHVEFDQLLDLFHQDAGASEPRVFADLSALLIGTRKRFIERICREMPQNRLLFGSDYPIPIFRTGKPKGPFAAQWIQYKIRSAGHGNPHDKTYIELQKWFDPVVFTNALSVLRLNNSHPA
jgi:predicted TIM-barrel fold metal-dependent hydrolase